MLSSILTDHADEVAPSERPLAHLRWQLAADERVHELAAQLIPRLLEDHLLAHDDLVHRHAEVDPRDSLNAEPVRLDLAKLVSLA